MAPRLTPPVHPDASRVTSEFGPRGARFHQGIDFAAATRGQDFTGADVLAAADGLVREARSGVSGFGCWIILEHLIDGELVHTVYGHMWPDDLLVDPGDRVVAGQLISRVGNNGESSGAHLHFEVWAGGRYAGAAVDPGPWLATAGGEVTA